MRLWSLGQQRCITTYRIHGEGVWALCANDNFTGFYSSGRDKHVMWTDLNLDDSSTLLFVEDAPVLKVSIVMDKSNKNRNWQEIEVPKISLQNPGIALLCYDDQFEFIIELPKVPTFCHSVS